MRIWRQENEENILDSLNCDLCGAQIIRTEGDAMHAYNFVRLYLVSFGTSKYAGQTADIDICEKCVYEKIMPLTLIERSH